jgi:hypothetical protein
MTNPYTGLDLTPADRYYGEPSDFGYRVCHGCEAGSDMGEWHSTGCPMKCIRVDCGYHFYIVPLVDKL